MGNYWTWTSPAYWWATSASTTTFSPTSIQVYTPTTFRDIRFYKPIKQGAKGLKEACV